MDDLKGLSLEFVHHFDNNCNSYDIYVVIGTFQQLNAFRERMPEKYKNCYYEDKFGINPHLIGNPICFYGKNIDTTLGISLLR